MPDFSFLFVQALNGLASASSLFIIAAGLTIVFGVTRIVNFAHGSFYMLGAFFAATLIKWTGSFVLSLLLATLACVVLGIVTERSGWSRMYSIGVGVPFASTSNVVGVANQNSIGAVTSRPFANTAPAAPRTRRRAHNARPMTSRWMSLVPS